MGYIVVLCGEYCNVGYIVVLCGVCFGVMCVRWYVVWIVLYAVVGVYCVL